MASTMTQPIQKNDSPDSFRCRGAFQSERLMASPWLLFALEFSLYRFHLAVGQQHELESFEWLARFQRKECSLIQPRGLRGKKSDTVPARSLLLTHERLQLNERAIYGIYSFTNHSREHGIDRMSSSGCDATADRLRRTALLRRDGNIPVRVV